MTASARERIHLVLDVTDNVAVLPMLAGMSNGKARDRPRAREPAAVPSFPARERIR